MRINVEETVLRREPLKKVTKPTPKPKVEIKPEPQIPVKRNQKWFDEQKKLRQ
jgi:hypothetical protein